jgi:transposase
LLFPEKTQSSLRSIPDCEWIHPVLAKSGMTLSLLWHEYCEQCRIRNEIPLQYSQFYNHYRKFAAVTNTTLHIQHKPGEKLEVD